MPDTTDGTSFAAPLTASVIAFMVQANPFLYPRLIHDFLTAAASPIPGVPSERQGAGALEPGKALRAALQEMHELTGGELVSPKMDSETVTFTLHHHAAEHVTVLGSWDGWTLPGIEAALVETGIWRATFKRPASGRYTYKFVIDGAHWLEDPANPHKQSDTFGGYNSVLNIPD
ncbi:MAG: glycogen-binding domain-containing protein [Aggregatilineales bacterium]